jgi:hypothetical protein
MIAKIAITAKIAVIERQQLPDYKLLNYQILCVVP